MTSNTIASTDQQDIDWMAAHVDPDATAIVARLQNAGHTAYLAGGCVRDLLLRLTPKDFDIATSARPDSVLALFPDAIETGRSFGVIRVPVDSRSFEIATFRKDHAYADGRHPSSVSFSDARTDAERRDFTINALFYDPAANSLIDFVAGMADLHGRLVRAVGDPDARFREDHLRLLRGPRFAAVLGFEIGESTRQAIQRNAGLLSSVSSERICEEFSRILLESPRPGKAMRMLLDLQLLDSFLPEACRMSGQAQNEVHHPEGDVFTHTALMLDNMRSPDLALALAVLFHDIGKPAVVEHSRGYPSFPNHAAAGADITRSAIDRLRFPVHLRDDVSAIVRNHMKYMDVQKMRNSTLRRLMGAHTFRTELELHRLDCACSHGKLSNYRFLIERLKEFEAEPVLPAPWVSGNDIMQMGIPQGPEVGYWRRLAYDLQLDGAISDRGSLLARIAYDIKSGSRPPFPL